MRIISLLSIGLVILGAGCVTPGGDQMSDKTQDGVGGALLGGALGAIVGNNVGDHHNQLLGAAIGAAVGGFAGGSYGQGQDQLNQKLDNIETQVNTTTVMVNNNNGSYTPVTLVKMGDDQWKGPHGEIYNGLPTAEQLRPVYGLK